jgi:catechol 2,3-dioxygenase-like lactoylglutathione lyase family enzyme
MPRNTLVEILLLFLCACGVVFAGRAQFPPRTVNGACHVGPTVSDLDKSARFYRDVIGLDLDPAPSRGADSSLYGLPKARFRVMDARMPGVACGIELMEFESAGQRPVHRRLQDPGSAMLILLVRDIDAIFARIKAAGATVVTKGGAPMLVGPPKTARAVVVQDPDGDFIELAQLKPLPSTDASDASNVIEIRLRITVADADKAASYYKQTLGLDLKSGAFTNDESVMAMMGLPPAGEYRVATVVLPNSSLTLEFIEFKGVGKTKARASRVQDSGSYGLQLNVQDIDMAVAALKNAASPIISSGGVPVQMTIDSNPWRAAVAEDPNNLFLVVQQRLEP